MKIKLRKFTDTEAARQEIYSSIKKGFARAFPLEGKKIRLRIQDVEIPEDKFYPKSVQKKAILLERDLTIPVKGTMILEDKETCKVLGKKKMSLGQVPYFTPKRGTFIGHGTEYSVSNQQRLRPGPYTRIKTNDEIETQFNTEGKVGFRVDMEPKTGIFRMKIGSNKLRLYPILKAFNVPDEHLKKQWGDKLFQVNVKDDPASLDRLYKKLVGFKVLPNLSMHEKAQKVLEEFKTLKLDPEISEAHLGERFGKVTPKALLNATGKIVRIYKGLDEPDDRNDIKNKTFWGTEDYIRERIEKDSGSLAKKLVRRLDRDLTLDKVPAGYFSKQLKHITRGDERATQLDAVNPTQFYENQYKTIVTGEGGIGSLDLVTPEARNVSTSHLGFIDPIRGPESEKIGIDTYATIASRKGSDKKIYARFINAKTRQEVYLNPTQAGKVAIAFPEQLGKKGKTVAVLKKGQIRNVPKSEVDYYMDKGSDLLSPFSVLVPMTSAVSGNRTFMAGKAFSDTIPVVETEAPLVRTKYDGPEKDFETLFGREALSELAPEDGTVEKITKNTITLKTKVGKKEIDLYDDFPLPSKTYIKSVPSVSVGDKVKKGDMLAHSNFNDKEGTLTTGKHLLSAYWPFRGWTFEDAIAISDTAAKKLTTEQMYKIEVPIDQYTDVSRNKFVSSFPAIYHRDLVAKVQKDGLVKPGTVVQKGDPLILAVRKKELTAQDLALGKLHKSLKNVHDDASATWSHEAEGVVSDIVMTGKKAKVYIKTKTPAKIGDKLTGRFGNKGVIGAILPDAEMPIVERTGERLELALNPAGVPSRTNTAQIFEGLLGKIAKEKGLKYRVPLFSDESYIDVTERELKKHGIPEQETMVDAQGNKIKIMVTYPYIQRLSKLAESQVSAREFGGYTSNMQPVKGKDRGGAIKVGSMELAALMGHGAKATMRDAATIKGERNDNYWRNLKMGYPLPSPEVPFVYQKFVAMMKAAGSNVAKKGDVIKISPLTDKETMEMSKGKIREPKFLSAKTLDPERGGFFDIGMTGGLAGKFWTHLDLKEPLPSPIMEKPIKSILGLSDNQFRNIVSGQEEIDGLRGGAAIKNMLSKIDVDKEIAQIEKDLPNMVKSKKNVLTKKLLYLKGIQRSEINPEDAVITKVPVLPPIFRPISSMAGSNTVITSDPNLLYRDIFHANNILGDLKQELPDEELTQERLMLYDTLRATTGVGPHVNQEFKKTGVKSFLQKIVGDKPKTGFFFDKLVSKTQDLVGRGVAVPNPHLGIDEAAIPDKIAWDIYRPFVMRRLVQRGMNANRADEEIEAKTANAESALEQEMAIRPGAINRAPTLHKFNMMSFNLKRHKNDGIAINPMVAPPYNLDHDGDAVQVHLPASEEARIEALTKMMPSQNLQSIQNYKVHYLPIQEDNYGLYTATSEDKKNEPVKIGSLDELERKLRSRELTYSDRINLDPASFAKKF
jgi:DNA-directed RNA polymerase beta subunit